MRGFFKIFFASLLSLIVFFLLVFFFLVAFIGGLTSKEKPTVQKGTVLVLDLGQHYMEQVQKDPFSLLRGDDDYDVPGVYDVVRLLRKAKTDNDIEGIYIIANSNPNGFAAGDEIRNALLDFKKSGKFILAYGDMITQKAYGIANVADSIYANPQGFVEWFGFNVDLAFIKGTLEKLEIEPQIFYAGKFKSATEPLRMEKMSDENKLQTSVWMNDLYDDFLLKTSQERGVDTGQLRNLANSGSIKTTSDALQHKLIDKVGYDDEIKDVIRQKLKIGKYHRINFITINSYFAANNLQMPSSSPKIAVIFAEGDIIDGKGAQGIIGSDEYRMLIRKARLDKSIRAIVFRINSGGGSSLASENIWRELSLAKQEKPVVVSFGDVAASGGYYIACAADSIFAQPTTITGSIGVFGIIPNMQGFFKNKVGVTFDGVKTGPYADAMTITRPMNENEKQMLQSEIDRIYSVFKQRVADGRKKDTAYVESIAQGRVWTGVKALENGLIDKFGGLNDAVACAARMAKVEKYQVREYPKPESVLSQFFGSTEPVNYNNMIRNEIGEDNFKIYQEMKKIREVTNTIQTRLPFTFFIH